MDDIHEPLERYRNEFRDAFKRNAEEAFSEMERLSGVDAEANRILCRKIDATRQKIDSRRSQILLVKTLRISCIVLSAVLMLSPFARDFIYWHNDAFHRWLADWFHPHQKDFLLGIFIAVAFLGAAAAITSIVIFGKKLKALNAALAELENVLNSSVDVAKRQMAPLNDLFSWDIPAKLIGKTVPNIRFDPYFNAARLSELENEFGYDGFLNDYDSSVIFAHSGEIKGNPFVIATVRKFTMGVKEYVGYKHITWTETETDSKGNTHTVVRGQTLTATVTKPCPEYRNRTFLMYASEAAPNLNFSRKPEGLSDGSAFNGIRKRRLRRKLEKFSRNLEDDSDYTMMVNKEFEVLFNTKDRDNEVEFRLLFTPLAQNEIIKLMNDRTEGYGDDFSIVKSRMLNVVYPEHLQCFSLDTDPQRFTGYRFDEVKRNFLETNREYFREIYFAFAPLLAIPLYQQIRTRKEIYGESLVRSSSRWEWESLANSRGGVKFAHSESVTENIMKSELLSDGGHGEKSIGITARGFRSENRTDYVNVWGGDGCTHSVPVDWMEYLPIEKETRLTIAEMPDSDTDIARRHTEYPADLFRRRILIKDMTVLRER